MALSMSFVLCSEDLGFLAVGVRSFLAASWPDLPPATHFSEAGNTLSFDVGAAHIVLGRMPAPFPWADLQGPCATSVLWPDAPIVLKGHRAHVVVTVSSDLGLIERAKLLTQVTAAAMATCPSALGVFWGNATLVVPKALFNEFAVQILPFTPPLHIWLDIRVAKNADGTSSGFTTGMAALGHMEFETHNSTQAPPQLRERLLALAGYVLEKGPVISDGNTVGGDAGEKIRVVFSDSTFGHPERVMRLVYELPQPKKPRWKIW
jgi:hypothetical protein